jgi:hypothetical protein
VTWNPEVKKKPSSFPQSHGLWWYWK